MEFNHSKSDYFTEIDAIMLVGTKYCLDNCDLRGFGKYKGPIQIKLESTNFQPKALSNQEEMIKHFLRTGLDQFIDEVDAPKLEEIVEYNDEFEMNMVPVCHS